MAPPPSPLRSTETAESHTHSDPRKQTLCEKERLQSGNYRENSEPGPKLPLTARWKMLTITLKTLQQQTFQIEIEAELTVSEVNGAEVNTVRPGGLAHWLKQLGQLANVPTWQLTLVRDRRVICLIWKNRYAVRQVSRIPQWVHVR